MECIMVEMSEPAEESDQLEPPAAAVKEEEGSSDQNFRKRKFDCLEQDEESKEKEEMCTELAEDSFVAPENFVEVPITKLDLSQQYVKLEPPDPDLENEDVPSQQNLNSEPDLETEQIQIKQEYITLSTNKRRRSRARVYAGNENLPPDVKKLVEKLGWTGKVRPIQTGGYFAICYHCEELLVGHKVYIKRHITYHFKKEIVNAVPSYDPVQTVCGICNKEMKRPGDMLGHYAVQHGFAEKVIPRENLDIKNIKDYLHAELPPFVNQLMEKLGWAGEVRQMSPGNHFAVCHLCQKLMVGNISSIKRHMVSHYKCEILEAAPNPSADRCCICDKICQRSDILAEHYAFQHGFAEKVIPREHFEITNITEFFMENAETQEELDSIGAVDAKLSPLVDQLVEKLGWNGEVKQMSFGNHFAICHQCQTLNVGRKDGILIHLATHYKAEILAGFPDGSDCSICQNSFPNRQQLFIHLAKTHEMAKNVMPDGHYECHKISDALGDNVDKVEDTELFAMKSENDAEVDIGDKSEVPYEYNETEPNEGINSDMEHSSEVEKLVVNLGWSGEVKQMSHGNHFAICHLCQQLLVGCKQSIQSHLIQHYRAEILEGLPDRHECSTCKKRFYNTEKLANHVAIVHKIAEKVIPEENFCIRKMSNFINMNKTGLPSSVNNLIKKLNWTGEVKQFSTGNHFIFCHHCKKLLVGRLPNMERHVIHHYRNEILEGISTGNQCSICNKMCRDRHDLAEHCVTKHGLAEKVIPKEHFEFNRISDVLDDIIDPTILLSLKSVGESDVQLSSHVKMLAEKLAWPGEVKQISFGNRFIFCHHCQILLAGCLATLQKHMIYHYKNEILKGIAIGNRCGICSKKCRTRMVLAEHCVKEHGIAEKVIPKEHFEFTKISDFLEGYPEMEQFGDARADGQDEVGFGDMDDGPTAIKSEEDTDYAITDYSHNEVGFCNVEGGPIAIKTEEDSDYTVTEVDLHRNQIGDSKADSHDEVGYCDIENGPIAIKTEEDTDYTITEVDPQMGQFGDATTVSHDQLKCKDAKKPNKGVGKTEKIEHSIFCYHCQKTLTGWLGNLQRHVICHYKEEILKGVSVGKTCNICSKICRDRSVLAEHCAKKHGRAEEVIPKEHFVFTRISKSKSTVKLSSDVEKLVEKLKWSGEVKQRSSGEYFSICHHCRTLNVGKRSSIQAHLATHYRTEIFEGFPEGNDCGLCKKRCSTRGELFIHYAISHEIAKKVIPKGHFECTNIFDFLEYEVDKTFGEARADFQTFGEARADFQNEVGFGHTPIKSEEDYYAITEVELQRDQFGDSKADSHDEIGYCDIEDGPMTIENEEDNVHEITEVDPQMEQFGDATTDSQDQVEFCDIDDEDGPMVIKNEEDGADAVTDVDPLG